MVMYICRNCNKDFRSRSTYKRHLLEAHGFVLPPKRLQPMPAQNDYESEAEWQLLGSKGW